MSGKQFIHEALAPVDTVVGMHPVNVVEDAATGQEGWKQEGELYGLPVYSLTVSERSAFTNPDKFASIFGKAPFEIENNEMAQLQESANLIIRKRDLEGEAQGE